MVHGKHDGVKKRADHLVKTKVPVHLFSSLLVYAIRMTSLISYVKICLPTSNKGTDVHIKLEVLCNLNCGYYNFMS